METKRTGGLRGALPSQAFQRPVQTSDTTQAGLLMKATRHAVKVCVLKQAPKSVQQLCPRSRKIFPKTPLSSICNFLKT